MGIYKTIHVTHDVYTTAEENKGYPRIVYTGSEPSFPIELVNRNGSSICMSLEETSELLDRLSLFMDSLDDIDRQHMEVEDLVSDYCSPILAYEEGHLHED